MSGTADSTRFLSPPCLIVDNLDAVLSFITQVFDGTQVDNFMMPVRYSVCRLEGSEEASMLCISKSACSPQQIEYFKNICGAPKQLYLVVKDPLKVQKRAMSVGAQINESCEQHSSSGDLTCSFEGPEELTFTVISKTKARRVNIHELMIAASTQSPALETDTDTPHTQTDRSGHGYGNYGGGSKSGSSSPVRNHPPAARVKKAPVVIRVPTLEVLCNTFFSL